MQQHKLSSNSQQRDLWKLYKHMFRVVACPTCNCTNHIMACARYDCVNNAPVESLRLHLLLGLRPALLLSLSRLTAAGLLQHPAIDWARC
jgi:hypothetical protein